MTGEWRNRHIPWYIRRNRYATAAQSVRLPAKVGTTPINDWRFQEASIPTEALLEQ